MKKQKHTLFVLSASLIGSLLMLAGCGGSDDSSTADSSTADSSTAVPTAVPESLADTTLTFNPSISFTTDTFDYVNIAPTNTGLPTEAATGATDSQKSGDSLVITMIPDDGFWEGKSMELKLSEFMDHQNDGIIDSYFCEFEWGDVKGSANGSFEGDGPDNPDYKEVVDNGDKGDKGVGAEFSGAPTVEEWNEYIVGMWILDTEDGDDDGASYAGQIVSATKIEESETETEGEYTYVEDTIIEYEYEWVDEMTGKITYTSTSYETVTSSFGEDRYIFKEKGVITLKFTDFFNATYSNEYDETEAYVNGVVYENYPLESGTDTGTVEFVESGPAN